MTALSVIAMWMIKMFLLHVDAPGRDMMVVGIAGSHGKTTVSWLICGILEAMEQVTGK